VIMSKVKSLHEAVRSGDLQALTALLSEDPSLANAVSETDARGTYPLHVAAEANQAAAARVLLQHGADVALLDAENDSIALCWAAFMGHVELVEVLLAAGSEPSQRNKNGLTPLGCAIGGTEGKWQRFSKATLEDWAKARDIIRANGGVE